LLKCLPDGKRQSFKQELLSATIEFILLSRERSGDVCQGRFVGSGKCGFHKIKSSDKKKDSELKIKTIVKLLKPFFI